MTSLAMSDADRGTAEGEDQNQKNATTASRTQASVVPFWTQKQYDYFWKKYSWMTVEIGTDKLARFGCLTCRKIDRLGVAQEKSIHLSSEWKDCKVVCYGEEKSEQQDSMRKKLFLHDTSGAHTAAESTLLDKNADIMGKQSEKSNNKHITATENCLRTAQLAHTL